jgi:ankyrin repeat protein
VARLPIAVVLDACLDGRLSQSDTELLFRELVDRGAFTDGFGDNSWSPLEWAVDQNNQPIADLLLDHGADPDYGRHIGIGFSPIGSAIRAENVAAIEYLISRGANPGPGPATSMSPLYYAVTVEHHGCVVALLKAGASPNVVETARDSYGITYHTALTEAILHHREDPTDPPRAITRIVGDLLAKGADVNLADISGITPLVSTLHEPFFSPRAFFVEELLKCGADPNREYYGHTPLVFCIIIRSPMFDNMIPIVKLLIQFDADVNLCSSWYPRATPLELVLTHIESERKWDDYHGLKDLYWKKFLRLQRAGCFQMSTSVDQTLTLQNAPDDGWTRDLIPILLKAGAQVSWTILDKFYNALFRTI